MEKLLWICGLPDSVDKQQSSYFFKMAAPWVEKKKRKKSILLNYIFRAFKVNMFIKYIIHI